MTDELLESQEPVIELPSEADPQPEVSLAPVVVVPLEDVIEYLFPEDSESEEPEEAEETVELVDAEVDLPAVEPDPIVGLVEGVVNHLLDMIADLGKIEKHTGAIENYTETMAQTLDHPALTTPFEDYTVTEALLLLLLLSVFISACARMLRGGFSWLRS